MNRIESINRRIEESNLGRGQQSILHTLLLCSPTRRNGAQVWGSAEQRWRRRAGRVDLLGGCAGRSAVYTLWRIVSAVRHGTGVELHPPRAVAGAAPAAEKMCRALGAAGGSARGTRSTMRAHRSRCR